MASLQSSASSMGAVEEEVLSFSSDQQQDMRKCNEVVSGEVQILHWDGDWLLEQAPQGSVQSIKPVRVQGVSG